MQETLDQCRIVIEREANSVNDNPLVDADYLYQTAGAQMPPAYPIPDWGASRACQSHYAGRPPWRCLFRLSASVHRQLQERDGADVPSAPRRSQRLKEERLFFRAAERPVPTAVSAARSI